MSTYTLTYNSKLTEDYIHTAAILASSTATQPLATFLNSKGESEALLIHDSGELCHLRREPLSNSGWNIFGIGAVVQSIAAANSGSVWITDNGESIWQSNAGHWNSIGNLNGGLMGISAGLDGAIYGVADQGGTYHLFTFDPDTAAFQDNGAVPFSMAPVGSAGSLWSLSPSSTVLTNRSGSWVQAPGSFQSGDVPAQVSVGNDQSVWVRCANGSIYFYNTSTETWAKMAGVPPGATTLAVVNSQLLYVQIGNQIQACSAGSWTAVAAPPYTLAGISVGNDGSLWALDQHGTVWRYANSSWFPQMTPTDLPGFTDGHQVTEVVTGLHVDGNQYAFFVMGGNLYCSMFDENGSFGGYWTQNETPIYSDCSSLNVVNDPNYGSLLAYGITGDGNFLLVQNKNGTWTATKTTMSPAGCLTGAKVQFSAIGNDQWMTYALMNQTFSGGLGSLESPATTLSTSYTGKTLIPFSLNAPIFNVMGGLIDTQNQLQFFQAGTANPEGLMWTQLSGAAVGSAIGPIQSAVAMMSAATYLTRIYARDQNNMLWIIRQTGQTLVGPGAPPYFSWTEWHPLGDECIYLASGPTVLNTALAANATDLFTLDAGYQVNVLSEDPTTGAWTDVVMLKPAGTNTDAEYVTRYLSEITIVDENSVPQSDFQVTVTADEAIGIWVGSNLYNVSSSAPVQLTTNEAGQVTFAFFAADLHTPTFSFSADGLVNPPSIYPAQDVNNYLAGKANALPNRPVFDSSGATLKTAIMQTAPDWTPGATTPFVQGQTATANAPGAAQAITQVYTMPVSNSGTSGQWSVAASDAGLVGGSSFWHDLCKFGHDIDHAIKKAAMKVTAIAVDVEKKVVSFTMELANGLSQLLTLVVNTVKDVVSAVKSAFRFIERGIDEAIHWLKSLFSWGDILNTKKVLESSLNGMLAKLAENLNPTSKVYAGTAFNNFFNEFVTEITGAFNNAKSVFSSNPTFSSQTNSIPYPSAGQPLGNDPLTPTNLNNAQANNGTHSNYVHTHTMNYTQQGGTMPDSAMGDGTSGSGIFQTLYNLVTSKVNQPPFQPQQMQAISNLQSVFNDPKSFGDVVMYDVITAVQDMVNGLLEIVEDIVDAVLALAGNALAGLQTLLNKRIDIPVISWIWQQISKSPLTMLDLTCLGLAVPVTILYKLTFGLPNAAPPFTEAQAQQIIAAYSNPATYPWPAIASVNSGLAAESQPTYPFPLDSIILPFATLFYGISDSMCDLLAYQRQHPPNPTDTKAAPVARFFSIMKIISSLLLRGAAMPLTLFPAGATNTPGKQWSLMNWFASFFPVAASTVFVVAGVVKSDPVFSPLFGMGLAGVMAALWHAVGITASVLTLVEEKFNPFTVARNFIAPVPAYWKPALLTQSQPAAGIALACVIVGDAVFDGANGVLAFLAFNTPTVSAARVGSGSPALIA